MAYRVSMDELGIANDDTIFEGATPGDVWRDVAAYLKRERGIDLPDVDEVLGDGHRGIIVPRFDNAIPGQPGPVFAASVNPDEGSEAATGANLIVTRLLEKLRMGQQGAGGDVVPPGSSQSLVP